ncbi:hypothetical protein CERSUDRAFT_119095, partial [Gelatoporia subvermispora B]
MFFGCRTWCQTPVLSCASSDAIANCSGRIVDRLHKRSWFGESLLLVGTKRSCAEQAVLSDRMPSQRSKLPISQHLDRGDPTRIAMRMARS